MLARPLVKQELWLVLARLLVRALSLPIIVYLIVSLRLVFGVGLRHSVMEAIMVVCLRLVPGAGYRYSVVYLALHVICSRTFLAHKLV